MPRKWGAGCALRPEEQWLTIYSNRTQFTFLEEAKTRFKYIEGGLRIDEENKLSLQHVEGIYASAEALFYLYPLGGIVDSLQAHAHKVVAHNIYSPLVINEALTLRKHLLNHERNCNILCVHVRLEDSAERNAIWAQYVTYIDKYVSTTSKFGFNVSLFIITNGTPNEKDQMRKVYPKATVGCTSDIISECADPLLAISIEQETCSMADEFYGSSYSTFTFLIATLRAGKLSDPGYIVEINGNLTKRWI